MLLVPSATAVDADSLGLDSVPFGVSLRGCVSAVSLTERLQRLEELQRNRAALDTAEAACRIECLQLAHAEQRYDVIERLMGVN